MNTFIPNSLINTKISFMKSLVKKVKKGQIKQAQCCAKQSQIIAGCHD
ncbi:hypothetical protein AQPE_1245 [Aquipluma nitroreducens]|uniref:Uncharacterized protein n=1 Tax=Aquipluma nitroreducens TaxID=2010828 RepID=A0A5K7S6E5_9BACT|nr:hypothetical protein AQPE_1245 [Aquipluma nitroreducens]